MMKVNAKLSTTILGIGFMVKRGAHRGEMDDRGIVWLTVHPTHRVPLDRLASAAKRIGIHAGKFDYIEEVTAADQVMVTDKRAGIKAQIKAAESGRKQ